MVDSNRKLKVGLKQKILLLDLKDSKSMVDLKSCMAVFVKLGNSSSVGKGLAVGDACIIVGP